MSTATAQPSATTRHQGKPRVSGILGDRFEFHKALRRIGPVSLYSVSERDGRRAGGASSGSLVLKVLDVEDNPQPAQLDLFRTQAHVASLLLHENISPVEESGEYQGIPYCLLGFPSEYETLRSIMDRRGWLDLRDSVAYTTILQVCNALAYAHDQGVLHLSIQPDDIIIDQSGRALLTGFGLERDAIKPPVVAELASQIGTRYACPELLDGGDLSVQSDMYSLGVTLYEMITDRIPLRADPDRSRSRPAVAPCRIMESITPDVSSVIMELLEADPLDRFPHVAAFQAALIQAVGPLLAVAAVDLPNDRREDSPVQDILGDSSTISVPGDQRVNTLDSGVSVDLQPPDQTGSHADSNAGEVVLDTAWQALQSDIDSESPPLVQTDIAPSVEDPVAEHAPPNQGPPRREDIWIRPLQPGLAIRPSLPSFERSGGGRRARWGLIVSAGLIVLLTSAVFVATRGPGNGLDNRRAIEAAQQPKLPSATAQGVPDRPASPAAAATGLPRLPGGASPPGNPPASASNRASTSTSRVRFRKPQRKRRRASANSYYQPRLRFYGRPSSRYQ